MIRRVIRRSHPVIIAVLMLIGLSLLTGCATSVSATGGTGGTGSGEPTATQGGGPNPTDTPIPFPPHAPTRTPVPPPPPPPPNIAGYYSGSWSTYGGPGSNPMQMQVYQSGQSLSGTTTEGGSVASDSGTIASNGSFTITETWSNGAHSYLVGSLVGTGHLSGTWNNGGSTLGTWDVYK